MIKTILLILGLSSMAIAGCPTCVCKETISSAKGIEYENEIKKTIESKINPKIDEISNKTQKIKELQTKINDKLNQYRNLEIQSYVLNKQKTTILGEIKEQMSTGIDISNIETKAIAERVKGKIDELSLMQSKDINKDVSDFMKK